MIRLAILAVCCFALAPAETVSVSVLGLFHPTRLMLESADRPLQLQLDEAQLASPHPVAIELRDGSIRVRTPQFRGHGAAVTANGAFTLLIPGELERRYEGALRIEPAGEQLRAVVSMDLDSAVAAVLAQESSGELQRSALDAQAIVSRSFLAAGGRHAGFDFCDTTHCQWLGAAQGPRTAFAQAARRTRGLVIEFGGQVVEALFSRRCGGRTRTLTAIGLTPAGYPYHAVECDACRRKPGEWERDLPRSEARELEQHPGKESSRLAVARRLGWSAAPSNRYDWTVRGDRLLLRGRGEGHGVGLCQAGARELAARGFSARQILGVYFPNTSVGTR